MAFLLPSIEQTTLGLDIPHFVSSTMLVFFFFVLFFFVLFFVLCFFTDRRFFPGILEVF